MASPNCKNWWIARVTFERRDLASEFLPEHCQGAAGWMACLDSNGENLRDKIESALSADGLRLLEIENPQLMPDISDIAAIDKHLANNIAELEPNKAVVWGTVHTYIADGEA
jgi:hypothetical protein